MAGGQILQIAERDLGTDRCELRLEGELDLWSVERLQAALQRVARENDVVLVGLEQCEFVDSTGIALFLQVRRQLDDEGGRLLLYGCSDQVLRDLHRRRPDRRRDGLRQPRRRDRRAGDG